MKYQNRLKQILSDGRPYWDRDEVCEAVRQAFRKALQCGTAELGAEVYGCDGHEHATVIQAHVCAIYSLRVGVIAILHTFNGQLEFNSHVHTMVTAGGLSVYSETWVSSIHYDRDLL